MNECEQIQEQISAMLDGELSPTEEAAVQAHIRQCNECRAIYEVFATVSDAMTPESLPPDLHNRIMTAVQQRKVHKTRAKILRSVLATAASVILIVGVVFTLQPRGGGIGSSNNTSGAVQEFQSTSAGSGDNSGMQSASNETDGGAPFDAEAVITETAEEAPPESTEIPDGLESYHAAATATPMLPPEAPNEPRGEPTEGANEAGQSDTQFNEMELTVLELEVLKIEPGMFQGAALDDTTALAVGNTVWVGYDSELTPPLQSGDYVRVYYADSGLTEDGQRIQAQTVERYDKWDKAE